jgi:hypothetical protein
MVVVLFFVCDLILCKNSQIEQHQKIKQNDEDYFCGCNGKKIFSVSGICNRQIKKSFRVHKVFVLFFKSKLKIDVSQGLILINQNSFQVVSNAILGFSMIVPKLQLIDYQYFKFTKYLKIVR